MGVTVILPAVTDHVSTRAPERLVTLGERLFDPCFVIVVGHRDLHLPLARRKLGRDTEVRDSQQDKEDHEEPDDSTLLRHLPIRLRQQRRCQYGTDQGAGAHGQDLAERLAEAIADDAAKDPDPYDRCYNNESGCPFLLRQINHLPAD